MRKMFLVLAMLLVGASPLAYSQAAPEPPKLDLPTDDQITEILVQSDRALQMNRHCLLAEQGITNVDVSQSLKTDKEGQEMAGQIIEKIRSDHGYFHGGMDVMLLTALDDVSRNAALTSMSLMSDALQDLLLKGPKSSKVTEQIKESQACTESSAFIYTVSENLNHLVIKELKAANEISDEREVLLTKVVQCSK